ncbi:hypothetical protein AND_002953 [Anopheles darlingi]|uniref:Uncharacterized protein n=1 Tax=Anopheles darlingi TaxID=43151 RepID=W5JLN8_ANODA|nr:hypothetical protein AND_002953 [Anopheles darlingi]
MQAVINSASPLVLAVCGCFGGKIADDATVSELPGTGHQAPVFGRHRDSSSPAPPDVISSSQQHHPVSGVRSHQAIARSRTGPERSALLTLFPVSSSPTATERDIKLAPPACFACYRQYVLTFNKEGSFILNPANGTSGNQSKQSHHRTFNLHDDEGRSTMMLTWLLTWMGATTPQSVISSSSSSSLEKTFLFEQLLQQQQQPYRHFTGSHSDSTGISTFLSLQPNQRRRWSNARSIDWLSFRRRSIFILHLYQLLPKPYAMPLINLHSTEASLPPARHMLPCLSCENLQHNRKY